MCGYKDQVTQSAVNYTGKHTFLQSKLYVCTNELDDPVSCCAAFAGAEYPRRHVDEYGTKLLLSDELERASIARRLAY